MLFNRLLIASAVMVVAACNTGGTASSEAAPVRVAIQTEAGVITLELYAERAPVTVQNFIEHAEAGHFHDGAFYRAVNDTNERDGVAPIHIIQGGVSFDGLPDAVGIAHESTLDTGLTHQRGAISMARDSVGTATTEFFIMLNDSPSLDAGPGGRNPDEAGYAVFGQVIGGMDVVEAIWSRPTGDPAGPEGFERQWLNPAITITDISVLD